jgi:ATP-dependent Lon protease
MDSLPAEQLRWRCDPADFDFDTTDSTPEIEGVLGQPTALAALEFALATDAPRQNVYVRGPRGTGRRTMVRQALANHPRKPARPHDHCYVHNFGQPDRPRLITLPAGRGKLLRRCMGKLADSLQRDFADALNNEQLAERRIAVEQHIRSRLTEITEPLERELRRAGMALVPLQHGPIARPVIFPLVEGEPVSPAQLRKLVRQGKVPEERLENFEAHYPEFEKKLQAVSSEIGNLNREGFEAIQSLNEKAAREFLDNLTHTIRRDFDLPAVRSFLDELVEDVIETRLGAMQNPPDPHERYGVNVVLETPRGAPAPVVDEHVPSAVNLLGSIEYRWETGSPAYADYRGVRAGALLRADGGYLVLNCEDLLSEPGAWHALTRTLRTGRLEIVPPERGFWGMPSPLNPEPIPISVRVILLGDIATYYALDALDRDFGDLFKVLADFDREIDRDANGIKHYGRVIAHIAREENLLRFHRSGAAALTEHGARIAAQGGKLTAQFGRIADIAREAAFLAAEGAADSVQGEHVQAAIKRTKARASLPSRRFQQLIRTGTIQVQVTDQVVGQVNGLAVMSAGPLTFGFPARITATIGPGRAGLVSIEGAASLSGSIHTKGFHILGGLLRYLLRAEHPLAFSASVAFEQSYGGIDGDSASAAEICCLLSALTDIPLHQNLAITGAVDQHGHIQAIGGVNEKVEGFFDACDFFGLTGEQGVIIPRSNAGDLMLRQDVVQACEAGRFHVYSVGTIYEALELLTGRAAGEPDPAGYAGDSVLGIAVRQARSYWEKTLRSPAQLTHQPEGMPDAEGAPATGAATAPPQREP